MTQQLLHATGLEEKLQPLVSCIMPTANREKFIPSAIKYFQYQNYLNKELIIVDDGEPSVEHLIPVDDKTIRYIRLNQKRSTGAKRNMACDLSSGNIIVHMDDDDWYAPDWIFQQTKFLMESGADVCGLSELYFYSLIENKCWKYNFRITDKSWVAGASMAYLKSFWGKRPFNDIRIGEDNVFIGNPKTKIKAHSYTNGMVVMMHFANTVKRATTGSQWLPVSLFEIQPWFIHEDFNK